MQWAKGVLADLTTDRINRLLTDVGMSADNDLRPPETFAHSDSAPTSPPTAAERALAEKLRFEEFAGTCWRKIHPVRGARQRTTDDEFREMFREFDENGFRPTKAILPVAFWKKIALFRQTQKQGFETFAKLCEFLLIHRTPLDSPVDAKRPNLAEYRHWLSGKGYPPRR